MDWYNELETKLETKLETIHEAYNALRKAIKIQVRDYYVLLDTLAYMAEGQDVSEYISVRLAKADNLDNLDELIESLTKINTLIQKKGEQE